MSDKHGQTQIIIQYINVIYNQSVMCWFCLQQSGDLTIIAQKQQWLIWYQHQGRKKKTFTEENIQLQNVHTTLLIDLRETDKLLIC